MTPVIGLAPVPAPVPAHASGMYGHRNSAVCDSMGAVTSEAGAVTSEAGALSPHEMRNYLDPSILLRRRR